MLYQYLITFILGGTLLTLLFHFSKENNTIISSVIPALPALFLSGLIFLIYFNGNTKTYIRNSCFVFFVKFVFCVFLYFMVLYFDNLLLSIIIGLFLSFIIVRYAIKYKILK
jgi:hypothetical protein